MLFFKCLIARACMASAISIKGLNKWYAGGLHALKDVDLEIEKGDFFGYLGKNGAGKTTTINCNTALSNFQQGNIKVHGFDVVKEYREARKRIGLAQQDLLFDPALTVKQIVMYQAGYFGLSGRDVEDKTFALLKEFKLEEKAGENFRKLSTGMKRKLQLVKALVHEPEVLILDEPTATMDVETRHELWHKLRKLNRQGTTIVLTSHYIEEIERLCGKVGIIHEGKLIAFDGKKAFLSKLGNPTVRVLLQKPLEKLPAGLKALDARLMEKNKAIAFTAKNAQEKLPSLLQALKREKAQVKSVDIAQDKLEDIYLRLTGEGNDEV